eukprot:TRINITY_DN36299_c0_g1_i1.p1 TRINITY_DN36299_c0_g1~~TRINITY_DN36299_c0_g1_i1.p1  ORF type:complete len:2567 (+),score=549.68 TRINITY_DN36299_c0_g1_i1:191-7891(+)
MLEGVLEQLLLQFLAPYVDGISRDKLHVGVLSGALELTDLTVKPEALSLLGMEGYRVESGTIGSIKLSIPWSKLYTGKLRASVDNVFLRVESIAGDYDDKRLKKIQELREGKRKAIDVRMHQLGDLLRQREEVNGGASEEQKGLRVKLVRKIIHNLTVSLSDVHIHFVSPARGFAMALHFPTLEVLSTDETFREKDESEEVVASGTSLYKLLRLQDLSIKMSPAGSSDLSQAEYIVSPLCASLQLAHVPIEQKLRLRLEVAYEGLAEMTLRRSQVKHIRGFRADIAEETRRLWEMIVPPAEERSIFADPKRSRDEYSQLYERHLRCEWKTAGESVDSFGGTHPLSDSERKRMLLLEDAFATRVVALARVKVRNKLEALNQEIVRRQLEAEKARREDERARKGFWSRLRGRGSSSILEDVSSDEPLPMLTAEERDQLLEEAEENCKYEDVDLPQCYNFEFVLGKMALDLIDDQWSDEVQRQLMSLALKDAVWTVNVGMATDHRGQDSAEWCMELSFGAFHAFHRTQAFFTFCPPAEARWLANMNDIQPIVDDSSCAAKLVVESKLREDMNLLGLLFEFSPVQIHMLPGVVELVLEFWRSPRIVVAAAQSQEPEPEHNVDSASYDDFKDMGKQWISAHGDQAKKVAEQVYERIPDRLELKVNIASPILHVPVSGYGTAVLCLGQLSMVTPQPCAYDHIELEWLLDHTVVYARSLRNERFDMIQPVPITLGLEYRALDEENAVNVKISVKEMLLSVSPQALQILLCVPGAMMSIMYPKNPEPPKEEDEVTALTSQSSSRATSVSAPGPHDEPSKTANENEASEGPEAKPSVVALGRRASDLAEVLGEKFNTEDGENIIEVAARKVEQVRRKQFRLNLGIEWEAIDMTLADSIVPVMRLRIELMKPGLVMYQQSIPYFMTMKMPLVTMEMDLLNPRNGSWEPLAERFHFGLELERKPHGEELRSSHFVISGHEPLLLNLTPTAVKRASWIIPQFISSVTFGDTSAEGGEADGVKYRVVNLTDEPLELLFKSRHKEGLQTTIWPTGSNWESLDEWVLPHFSTAIAVRQCPRTALGSAAKGHYSELLPLERVGAVPIPCSGYIAELLTPGPSHRLLLLSTPLRVHNQTDLTLHVRFHDGAEHHVYPLDMPPTRCCDAALIGHSLPPYPVYSQFTERVMRGTEEACALELPPNAVCAVPASALIRKGGERDNSWREAWMSVRTPGLSESFSEPQPVGLQRDAAAIHCSSGRGSVLPHRGVHVGKPTEVVLTSETQASNSAFASRTLIATVALRPMLSMLNALPIGKLSVRYSQRDRSGNPPKWRTLEVPRFSCWNVYNFPGAFRDGIVLQAKLEGDSSCPWSSVIDFDKEAIAEALAQGGEGAQMLELKQTESSAAAGVSVEIAGKQTLRFACPYWFIDRSGITSHARQLQHYGRNLPTDGGVTMMHSTVLEDPCELAMRSEHGEVISRTVFRLPPHWSVFRASAQNQPFVFCVQTDDIAPEDVLGAHCQVMTLRPRLVLTNSSESTIEVVFRDIQLAISPGQSIHHHWHVPSHEEDNPVTKLKFRPKRTSPTKWSERVLCGDAGAGSMPFAIPKKDYNPNARHTTSVEIWTVELAPVRGALAVTFREGSDFAVLNQSSIKGSMFLRPADFDESLRSLQIPHDKEVAYGWQKPFDGKQRRGVELIVRNKKIELEDVRQSLRRPYKGLNLAIVITRVGTKTLMTLQDLEPPSSAMAKRDSTGGSIFLSAPSEKTGALLKVDIKVSRLGISIVEEVPLARELLYIHFDLVRFTWSKNASDVRQFQLAISEAQVDCQFPKRLDGSSLVRRQEESLGLMGNERPAVILANTAEGDRAFLHFFMQRGSTSSRDNLLQRVELRLDTLDLTIDDGWLEPLVRWHRDATNLPGSMNRGKALSEIQRTAGRSVLEGYSAPELPSIVQVDSMEIGGVNLTVWCALKLKTVRFLPRYVRAAIRLFSFSGTLTLDGAWVNLPERKIPPHRGSLGDFMRGLVSEYTLNLLHAGAQMFGKSSVLNLPRGTLKLGGAAVSFATDSFGMFAGEAASLLGQLTFDDEYIARQRQIREQKRISGFGDGMIEAGKSIAQGIEGIADIWRKPAEGAKKDGVAGFFSGLAHGTMSAIVKPMSNLGGAISDVGTGIAAQASPDSVSSKRRRARARQRLPRLLFSHMGSIRPWSELDADVFAQLGRRFTLGVEEGPTRTVLLLFRQRLLLVDLQANPNASPGLGGHDRPLITGTSASSSSSSPYPPRPSAESSQSSHSHYGHRGPPEDTLNPLVLFEAIDETVWKLGGMVVNQAMKPINTLYYGYEDMQAHLFGHSADDDDVQPSEELLRRARELTFEKLKDVHLRGAAAGESDTMLMLEETSQAIHNVPLQHAPITARTRQALAAGFRSAIASPDNMANWEELHASLMAERREKPDRRMVPAEQNGREHRRASAGAGAGKRVLEVFEVERKLIADWITPYLPIDRELAWRWVDATGTRHPHILKGLSQDQCSQAQRPPCELDGLFRPTSTWSIDKNHDTDPDGWRYALAWNSSTWDSRAGLFDGLRRRRWTREYQ